MISNHVAAECFEGRVPPAWQKQHQVLLGKCKAGDPVVQCVNVNQGESFASMAACYQPRRAEEDAFTSLSSTLAEIPRIMEVFRVADPNFFTRFQREEGAEMLGQMLAVTDGLIEDAFAEDDYLAFGARIDPEFDEVPEEVPEDMPDGEDTGRRRRGKQMGQPWSGHSRWWRISRLESAQRGYWQASPARHCRVWFVTRALVGAHSVTAQLGLLHFITCASTRR